MSTAYQQKDYASGHKEHVEALGAEVPFFEKDGAEDEGDEDGGAPDYGDDAQQGVGLLQGEEIQGIRARNQYRYQHYRPVPAELTYRWNHYYPRRFATAPRGTADFTTFSRVLRCCDVIDILQRFARSLMRPLSTIFVRRYL